MRSCLAYGGAAGCVSQGLGEFTIIEGGGVDEPANAVSIVVDKKGAAEGATEGVKLGDDGFGELSGREVFDFEVDVEGSCRLDKIVPVRECAIVDIVDYLRS